MVFWLLKAALRAFRGAVLHVSDDGPYAQAWLAVVRISAPLVKMTVPPLPECTGNVMHGPTAVDTYMSCVFQIRECNENSIIIWILLLRKEWRH